jgi:hypothetical protein
MSSSGLLGHDVVTPVVWQVGTMSEEHIQGDSGRKVNILAGKSICHCKKKQKSSYDHVSNSEWLPT